jgi:phage tail sheath protein FI
MIYERPDVYIEEVAQIDSPIQPAQLGFGCLMGITERGPLKEIVRTRSFSDWQRIYGGRETRSDMAYEAESFFKEGGVELLTSRMANYTDVDDDTTYTGGVSSRMVQTDNTPATAASKVGAIGPYNLEPAQTVVAQIDNDVGGAETATFDAAPSTKAGSGLSITSLTGDTLQVAFDGGETQTVTFAAAHTADPDGAAAEINTKISGGYAVVNTGQIDIVSDTKGTSSLVNIIGGTALTELGHSVGAAAAGTGDVADINAVTATEVKTVFEADFTGGSGVTVTVNANGSFTITSNTTGTTSELDFQSGTALSALGLSVEVITGAASGTPQNTIKFEAAYHGTVSPGVRGNDIDIQITQNPKHASAGAGNDLAADITALDTAVQVVSLTGITAKSVIRVWDGTNEEFKEVLGVRSEVSAGVVQFFVDIVGSFTNGYTAATTAQLESREFDVQVFFDNVEVEAGQWTQMSMLDTADNYIETLMNDDAVGSEYVMATDQDAAAGIGADLPATDSAKVAMTGGTDESTGMTDVDWIGSATGGTGIYALSNDIEFMPFGIVGNNNAAVVHAASQYARNKIYLEYIGHCTLGSTATQAKAYRETTLGLDSSYVSIYSGGIKVFDPAGSGTSPKRSLNAIGAQMGIRARVDSLPSPNGGPWQTPAGEGDYGQIRYALDVVDIYNDDDHALLNAAHVNVIRKYGKTSPVLTFGGRTLDGSVAQKWRYINVRRFFQFCEKSVADSTRWGLLRNNDFRLWSRLKDRVDEFLSDLLKDAAFPTTDKAQAFFVKMGIDDGTMTQTDVDNGRYIGEIGLAPQKPGEFQIWRFSQFEGGTSIEEG